MPWIGGFLPARFGLGGVGVSFSFARGGKSFHKNAKFKNKIIQNPKES